MQKTKGINGKRPDKDVDQPNQQTLPCYCPYLICGFSMTNY